jgi:hypothetical protein
LQYLNHELWVVTSIESMGALIRCCVLDNQRSYDVDVEIVQFLFVDQASIANVLLDL